MFMSDQHRIIAINVELNEASNQKKLSLVLSSLVDTMKVSI